MKYRNGSDSILSRGPWMQLLRITHCPCSDGKCRSAVITGQPDTAWSVPARVSVKGKSVTGFVTMNDGLLDPEKEGYEFRHNKFGKNAGLLP